MSRFLNAVANPISAFLTSSCAFAWLAAGEQAVMNKRNSVANAKQRIAISIVDGCEHILFECDL
jgi:hypothetical protein